MAESTSATTSVAPSSEQVQQTSPAPQQSDGRVSNDRPANLFDDPNFRNYQRQTNQTIGNLQAQLRQTQVALEGAQMRDMDDVERLQYNNQRLQQELAYRDQMAAEAQMTNHRYQILSTIANTTGVDINDLHAQGFDNADQAWAWAYQRSNARSARQERRDDVRDVDLGGGAPTTAMNQWQSEVQEAKERGDAQTYVRLMRLRPK